MIEQELTDYRNGICGKHSLEKQLADLQDRPENEGRDQAIKQLMRKLKSI
jgi:hypothetical protein